MVKRSLDSAQGAGDGPRKAPRLASDADNDAALIRNAKDLKRVLRFQQDDPALLLRGHATLKAFLSSLNAEQDHSDTSKLDILQEYVPVGTTDLLQTWSFAAAADNEAWQPLVTAVTSNLASLAKTLSGHLQLRETGLAYAKSILDREYLRIISRTLSSESKKESLVSPLLRLLSEIVSFDGGALAQQVFREQELVFNAYALERKLRWFKRAGEEDARRPSVRTHTIRYVMAHLQVQTSDLKARILEMRPVLRTVLRHLDRDPPEVSSSALKTIETAVLRDSEIPRKHKSAILNADSLAGVLAVTRQTFNSGKTEARQFLQRVCTDADLGILLPSSWYPPGLPESGLDFSTNGELTEESTIRNFILARFIRHLRPHAATDERELMMSIFAAAPELVCPFITDATTRLNMTPKLTNTWLGYAALMFSIVELPVPDYFGNASGYRSSPPPMDCVIENILPTPLADGVLTRCINQSSSLIRFFALRLLLVVLRKTRVVFNHFMQASLRHTAYATDLPLLTARLLGGLPAPKDLYLCYHQLRATDLVSQEAAAHVLAQYQAAFPMMDFGDAMDFASPLAAVLIALQESGRTNDDRILLELQLKHLLPLNQSSLSTRWWQRTSSLAMSPYTTLLQLCARRELGIDTLSKLRGILEDVAVSTGIVQNTTPFSAVGALLTSLHNDETWQATAATWSFVDDCILRYVKKPIKYGDDLEALSEQCEVGQPIVSALLLVILEQAPFLDRAEAEQKANAQTWICRYICALEIIGEDKQIIKALKRALKPLFNVKKHKLRPIEPRIGDQSDDWSQHRPAVLAQSHDGNDAIEAAFTEAPEESDKYPELLRYKKQDIDDLIHEGTLNQLLLSLCSEYPEIRKQGLTALRDVQAKVLESKSEIKDQIWLLLGEVIETAEPVIDEHPMAYLAGSFACAALKVTLNPSHIMYSMVARYLIKDPYWNVRKLSSYWLRKTLYEDEPHEAEKYWDQIAWTLEFLLDGVRRPADARLLYVENNIELVLELFTDTQLTSKVASLIIELVHRVIAVDGARNMTMNVGVLSWVEEARMHTKVHHKSSRALVQALRDEVVAVKEDERVKEWLFLGGKHRGMLMEDVSI